MLKEIIAVCATIVTVFYIYVEGDTVALASLFTMYGTLLGYEVGKATKE